MSSVLTSAHKAESQVLDNLDREIIAATQDGLPLLTQPYAQIASNLGIDEIIVLQRLKKMLCNGIIRRIGVVPNHFALGYTANGMSVWNVPDIKIRMLGAQVGALDFVSHCYHRPRFMPLWPYNLFAMVHGHSRNEVHDKVKCIADLLGHYNQGHDVLFSKRILKKTGLRIKQ